MDFSRDETRRRLDDASRHHDEAMPQFERALGRAFDPEGGASDAEKHALLGLPHRRDFLRIGGLSVATSAFVVACVSQEKSKEVITQTGTLVATTTTSSTIPPGTPNLDATFLLTAISIEWLAVSVYKAAVENKWITTPLLVEVAATFQGQHEEHAGRLATQATRMDQKPNTNPNDVLKKLAVDPALETLKALKTPAEQQAAALRLALDLEDAAAQTYTKAGGLLSTPELRAAIMSIGGIEARHYAVLAGVVEQPQAPFALEPTGKAAPDEALIAPKEKVTPYPSSTKAAPSSTASPTRR